jgi:hypothetical protein
MRFLIFFRTFDCSFLCQLIDLWTMSVDLREYCNFAKILYGRSLSYILHDDFWSSMTIFVLLSRITTITLDGAVQWKNAACDVVRITEDEYAITEVVPTPKAGRFGRAPVSPRRNLMQMHNSMSKNSENSDKLFIKKMLSNNVDVAHQEEGRTASFYSAEVVSVDASISGFKDSIDMLENTSKIKKGTMVDSESVDCLEKIGTSKTMSALEKARAYLEARKRLASIQSLQSYQQERPRFELMRQVANQGKVESEQSTRKTQTWVSPFVGYEERRGVCMKGSQTARQSIIKTARESESRRILRKSGFRGGSGVLTGSSITRSNLSQHSYMS